MTSLCIVGMALLKMTLGFALPSAAAGLLVIFVIHRSTLPRKSQPPTN